MAWIDYKKAYDMALQSCLKMCKIPRRKRFSRGKDQKIFKGDALSPLLFVIAMMPLNRIFRKYTAGYKLSKSQE